MFSEDIANEGPNFRRKDHKGPKSGVKCFKHWCSSKVVRSRVRIRRSGGGHQLLRWHQKVFEKVWIWRNFLLWLLPLQACFANFIVYFEGKIRDSIALDFLLKAFSFLHVCDGLLLGFFLYGLSSWRDFTSSLKCVRAEGRKFLRVFHNFRNEWKRLKSSSQFYWEPCKYASHE